MKTKASTADTTLTRRQFLRGAAFSTAAFMVVPGAVLGLRGAASPNGKLNLAGIGIGGQGAGDLSQVESENIVALCDVDKNYADHTFKKYPKAQQFTDYRQMLDQMKDIDGVVIVTMPSELSSEIVKKAVTFAERLHMPIIGVVENMSGFICPHCGTKTEIFQSGGGKKMAKEMEVAFLGNIPIDPTVGVDSDKGTPFVVSHKDSAAAKAFMDIVLKVQERLNQKKS